MGQPVHPPSGGYREGPAAPNGLLCTTGYGGRVLCTNSNLTSYCAPAARIDASDNEHGCSSNKVLHFQLCDRDFSNTKKN